MIDSSINSLKGHRWIMCGFAGILAYSHAVSGVSARELTRMRDRMYPRGPDGAGQWLSEDGSIGLAHRRLAILDLSDAGSQPMWSDCLGFCIVYNGEIYNFRALREELMKDGCRFRSNSDTEVLLHLFRRDREGACRKLRGMFAFAVWDVQRQELFIARDTFGIKPLYWHDSGTSLRIASQVKALMAGGAVDSRIEPAAAAGFFLWGYVPEPWTTVQGVMCLPAGHWMRIGRDGKRVLREYESVPGLMVRDQDEYRVPTGLNEGVRSSVLHHLIADVPVGVFLSSGIDSTVLTAVAAEMTSDLRTVTLGFEEFRGSPDDETVLAETTALHYGAKHETIWVDRNAFLDAFTSFFDQMDQPTVDGINTFLVSKAASLAGLKVALSGLGGDELFGGYPSFAQIPRAVRCLRWAQKVPYLASIFQRSFGLVPESFASPKFAGTLLYGGTFEGAYLLRRAMRLPAEILKANFNGVDRDVIEVGLQRLLVLESLNKLHVDVQADLDKVSSLETSWYMRSQLLKDSDWASMSHSVELRVPFVDRSLIETVVALRSAGSWPTKLDLGKTPRSPLPSGILNRAKTGFRVPIREWLLSGYGDPDATAESERGLRGWQRIVWDRCLAGSHT